MQKHKHNGFTLVELLITVAVIIILIGIALVSYKEIAERSVDAKTKQEIVDLEKALRLYHQKYQKMPNGDSNVISLCLIDHPSCREGTWSGLSVSSSHILSELRKVGYTTPPTSFSPSKPGMRPGWRRGEYYATDHRHLYELHPPLRYANRHTGHGYVGIFAQDHAKSIAAPMVRYQSNGSFYFLYFQDHRERCATGTTVSLPHWWKSHSGTRDACTSHPLDQLP